MGWKGTGSGYKSIEIELDVNLKLNGTDPGRSLKLPSIFVFYLITKVST